MTTSASSKPATTKIYIKDLSPQILRKRFSLLDEYFLNQETNKEIISPDGLFIAEKDKLYKLNPIDQDITMQHFEGNYLLFDTSYYERELVFSQIPYEHVAVDKVKFYYGIGEPANKKSKSFVTFVVEGVYEKTNNSIMNTTRTTITTNTTLSKDKYTNFIPTDFYFLANESFDNILVKKELNVFLSMVN